jgi:hypothetical protein
MYVVIQHTITDSGQWNEIVPTIVPKTPKDLKTLFYLPSDDGKKAICLWKANSIEAVEKFVEGELGACSVNDYYEVDSKTAMGLPG